MLELRIYRDLERASRMSLVISRQKRLILLSIVRSVTFVHYSVVQSCHDSFDLAEGKKKEKIHGTGAN